MNEIWKSVPGFGGLYEASSEGRIRNVRIFGRGKSGPKLNTLWVEKENYLRVALRKNKKARHYYVHTVILDTFIGPKPEGCVACHNDGDGKNNRIENLRWDTQKNNEADKRKHGTAMLGPKHHQAKLSYLDIKEILRRHRLGEKTKILAADFEVTTATISRTVRIYGESK